MKKVSIFLLLVITISVLFSGKIYFDNGLDHTLVKAQKAQSEYEKIQEQKDKLEKNILDDIPGIISWGDSLTAGAGGDGVSYPSILQQLISKNIYRIPVVNMGVGGETTSTIIGRAGSVPYVVKKTFEIPEDSVTKVEISFESDNGNEVAPLLQGDKLNPVTISEIEGTVTFEKVSSNETTYYFQRSKGGKSVHVKKGTEIISTNKNNYNNYLPIIFMGTNGGFDGYDDLTDQIDSIINMDKSNDKFLVLGLTFGTEGSQSKLDGMLEKAYGDRFINIRKYIIENGLEQAKIEPTEDDTKAIKVGSIPPSLLFDSVHFNADGYKIIANAVYERMVDLKYFEKILETKEEKDSM